MPKQSGKRMSNLFMEKYITLLIHFVNECDNDSDALAHVENFILRLPYYCQYVLTVHDVGKNTR